MAMGEGVDGERLLAAVSSELMLTVGEASIKELGGEASGAAEVVLVVLVVSRRGRASSTSTFAGL